MKAIRLERFKGYEDSGWIDLNKPITLIFGNNSSGKSAFLSSILMLKQSVGSMDSEKPFIFNAKNGIDIGSFEDAVFQHNVDFKKPMIFSFEVEVDRTYKEIGLNEGNSVVLSIKVAYNKKRRFNTLIGFDLLSMHDKRLIMGMHKKTNAFSAKPHYETDLDVNISNLKVHWFNFIPLLSAVDEKISEMIIMELSILSRHVAIDISKFLDRMAHVGPLRQEPQRTYHFTGETPVNVGRDGSNAPQILLLDKYSATTKRIIDDVNSKLKIMGYSLSWDILKGGIAHIMLTDLSSNKEYNLKDVGFGISQLLPLLIQGYDLNESQFILLEQPEIHLHPSAQSNLGDFFIELSKQNKFFIIETHSEHILLRLRRRIADKTISNEDVNIYFVERKDGKSIISNIKLDDYGQMVSVPDGFKSFFSDDYNETMEIVEAISKRKSNGS